MNKPSLLFDLDNTLCQCSKYYLEQQDKFIRWKADISGVPKQVIQEIFKTIDIQQTKFVDGFSRDRFPRSFAATSMAVDVIAKRTPSTEESELAVQWAEDVFEAEYELFPNTLETLHTLGQLGWQMILVTKGDPVVQQYKVTKNKLDQFFPAEFTNITLLKNIEFYQTVLDRYQVNRETSFMIGDSLKDDIHPAKTLGLTTVHIDATGYDWSYDRMDTEADYYITKTIANLPAEVFQLPQMASSV